MLKRILKTGAGALCAVAILTNVASADVNNQRDTVSNANPNNPQVTGIPDNGGANQMSNAIRTVSISQNELIQDVVVTIEGLQHNFVGDLTAVLTKVGADTSISPGGSNIFSRIQIANPGSTGQSASVSGNYTFTSNDPANPTNPASIWDAAAVAVSPLGDGAIANSTFDSTVYSAVNAAGTEISLANAFAGQTTQGDWRFVIRDEAGGNVGSFTGVSLSFQSTAINAVPEPTSATLIAMASLGLCMRRRRK